ncbi:hypothetical protein [Tahibacter sp.]|uniref:hypothetical protein n=1 Tax=Tahibacter sp. TaxID=2056211 RepID=UPI0028C3F94B|nr:hypothetical protein [Tahibacter sp.]
MTDSFASAPRIGCGAAACLSDICADAPTLTTLIAKPNTYLIIPIPCDESGEPETGDHRPRPG